VFRVYKLYMRTLLYPKNDLFVTLYSICVRYLAIFWLVFNVFTCTIVLYFKAKNLWIAFAGIRQRVAF